MSVFPSSPHVSTSAILLTCQTVEVNDKRVAGWAGEESEVLDDKAAIFDLCLLIAL